jgi:hypothetical protein
VLTLAASVLSFEEPDFRTLTGQPHTSLLADCREHLSPLVHPDLLCVVAPELEFFRIRTTEPPSSNEISSINVFIR